MPHYDEETLALLALGESGVTTDNEAHLDNCRRCRDEVDQLKAVVATARLVSLQDQPVAFERGVAAHPGRSAAASPCG